MSKIALIRHANSTINFPHYCLWLTLNQESASNSSLEKKSTWNLQQINLTENFYKGKYFNTFAQLIGLIPNKQKTMYGKTSDCSIDSNVGVRMNVFWCINKKKRINFHYYMHTNPVYIVHIFLHVEFIMYLWKSYITQLILLPHTIYMDCFLYFITKFRDDDLKPIYFNMKW